MIRYFALVLGIAFTLAGIGGFVPWVTQPADAAMPDLTLNANYGLLLGLFPVNLVHNLIHISFAVWGLAASRSEPTALIYTRSMAIILTIFTVMGLLPALSTTLGVLPLFGHDIWLHGLEATVAFYLGWWQVSTVQSVQKA
jgi:hypothetical protein